MDRRHKHNSSVKDKNNIISYDAWTGSDYHKIIPYNSNLSSNTNDLSIVSSSNEWSINGERSIKLTNAPITTYIVTQITEFDMTKSYTAKIIVLTTVSMRMDVILYDGNTKIKTLRSSIIPSSTEPQTIQVSLDSSSFTSNVNMIEIRAGKTQEGGVIYMDNWELLKQ